jgi:hypothetical protein
MIADILRVMIDRCVDRSCEGGDYNSAQAATSEQCRDYYGARRVDEWCDMCLFNEAIKALEQHVSAHASPERPTTFDFTAHLARQAEFSERTFGPGVRTAGVVDHIRKELCEIEAKPHDLSEWIDVVILGLDGAWRVGYTPEQIVAALVAKQAKNEARTWPDWHTAEPGKAIEHVRATPERPRTTEIP